MPLWARRRYSSQYPGKSPFNNNAALTDSSPNSSSTRLTNRGLTESVLTNPRMTSSSSFWSARGTHHHVAHAPEDDAWNRSRSFLDNSHVLLPQCPILIGRRRRVP